MSRAELSGDQVRIHGKIAARYDSDAERVVIGWFKELLGLELKQGMREMEKQLRNGQDLVKLAAVLQKGTANCPGKSGKMRLKATTLSAPFKQMENIQTFLNFCENYGVGKTSLFQTVDLFEGRNMAQVLNCIEQLGTEAQRNGFNGPTVGSRPTEKNVREFSDEQLRAGNAIIGLQAGTNKCASQAGMSMGSVRHVADIRADDMSQAGQSVIGLQAGSNKGASQAGMSMGSVRHVSDIRSDDMSAEGQGIIGLQAGSNKGASQAGMSMGSVRHVSDIRADDMSKDGQSIIGLQAGSNKGASQSGMSMGSVRHVSDIKTEAGVGQDVIGLQMGSNKGATQSGMAMGSTRHVSDIKTGQMDQSSQGVSSLQYGSNVGASQTGMSMGGKRDIK